MRTLSFCRPLFTRVGGPGPSGSQFAPASIVVPWYRIAFQHWGRPPVLSYASMRLQQPCRINPHQPIELGTLYSFRISSAGLMRKWFVLIHIDIEAKAGPGLQGLIDAQNAAQADDAESALAGLRALAVAQEAMETFVCRNGAIPHLLQPRTTLYPWMEK